MGIQQLANVGALMNATNQSNSGLSNSSQQQAQNSAYGLSFGQQQALHAQQQTLGAQHAAQPLYQVLWKDIIERQRMDEFLKQCKDIKEKK